MKRGFHLVDAMIALAVMGVIAAVLIPTCVNMTKTGRGLWNNQMYGVQKVDDATRYSTLKDVEDTCRSMQASYKADVVTAAMYTKAGNAEWAHQVAIRANRTATSYNEFVLKNSFVWKGAVPEDIAAELKLVSP